MMRVKKGKAFLPANKKPRHRDKIIAYDAAVMMGRVSLTFCAHWAINIDCAYHQARHKQRQQVVSCEALEEQAWAGLKN
jgi:hypothetical protein